MKDTPVRAVTRRTFLSAAVLAPILASCGGTSPLRRAGITPVPAAGMPPEVPAPRLRVGDEWRYTISSGLNGVVQDRVIVRVAEADGTGYTIAEDWQSVGPVQARYDLNLNALRTRNVVNRPAFPRYRFPLALGKTWTETVTTQKLPIERYGNWQQQVQARVARWERLTVPAGTFTALRIDIRINTRNLDDAGTWGNDSEALWYVPEVRAHVLHQRVDFLFDAREVNNDVMVLDAFRPGT